MASGSASAAAAVEQSTCSWKRPAGACEPVARSCAECLNVTPTSGEECKLLPLSGMCVRTNFSPSFEDAWPAPIVGARNGSLIYMEIPTLLADSLEYCAADDSECAACLQDVKSTSAVCHGASDCVCLGACAAGAWDATAELLLPVLLTDEPFNSTDCVAGVSSGNASAAIDNSDHVDGSTLGTATSDNECMWAAQEGASDACGTLRSCYDCLNTPLASGTECTITSEGLCTTMDAYVFSSDYRLNASVHAPHFFPSSNTTYCEASDETCKACWSSPLFTAAFSGVRDASAFCVGADGCVCVAFCESNSYSQVVLDRFCDVATSAASDVGATSATGSSAMSPDWGTNSVSAMAANSLRLIGLIVALCVAIPVVVVVWYGQRGRRAARARALAWRNRPPANGPLLGLEGWKTFREGLIAEEQRTLQGDGESNEVTPGVSVTIELQHPGLAAGAAAASETTPREEEEEEEEEEDDVKDQTAYTSMGDSNEEQDERRRTV